MVNNKCAEVTVALNTPTACKRQMTACKSYINCLQYFSNITRIIRKILFPAIALAVIYIPSSQPLTDQRSLQFRRKPAIQAIEFKGIAIRARG